MFVQVGQQLMALVTGDLWVIANFKETQLEHIRPGQPADTRVDAFPGKVFHGHVDSIQRGTGARFSLLPPENATGNYVKVVQRVPVKIVFDDPPDPQYPLGSRHVGRPEGQDPLTGRSARLSLLVGVLEVGVDDVVAAGCAGRPRTGGVRSRRLATHGLGQDL